MSGHDLVASAPLSGPGPARSDRPALVQNFPAVYRDYFDFVWSCTRRLGVSAAATDDVVQEVFIVIHARLHTLERPAALRSWIYGVVRRVVSAHHRARRSKLDSASPFDMAELPSPRQPTPLDLAEQNDQVKLLWSVLNELDDDKREVFVLAELEEMTAPEISEAIDIPINTAYSRLRAARQAFNEALARREARGDVCRT
ncbi:MAG: sigma-70 family RNA polymerase sigma factor [Pseudomonadota bacterium]